MLIAALLMLNKVKLVDEHVYLSNSMHQTSKIPQVHISRFNVQKSQEDLQQANESGQSH